MQSAFRYQNDFDVKFTSKEALKQTTQNTYISIQSTNAVA